MIPNLTGKEVSITGAAGGIGRILADAFLSSGASVSAPDISDYGLDDLAATHAGNRYVAANWDAEVSITDARAALEVSVAWPDLAASLVWPDRNPDTE
mgnify:CR=1 FL=1